MRHEKQTTSQSVRQSGRQAGHLLCCNKRVRKGPAGSAGASLVHQSGGSIGVKGVILESLILESHPWAPAAQQDPDWLAWHEGKGEGHLEL